VQWQEAEGEESLRETDAHLRRKGIIFLWLAFSLEAAEWLGLLYVGIETKCGTSLYQGSE